MPANVSLPGDGSFARQWWYDQQSAEDQALIDSGELEYPTHLAAATFTDTFALGDKTNINLNSNGQIKALRLEILDAPGGTVNNSINGSGNASFARNVATGAVYTDIIGSSTFNNPRNESSLNFPPVNSESCVTLTLNQQLFQTARGLHLVLPAVNHKALLSEMVTFSLHRQAKILL